MLVIVATINNHLPLQAPPDQFWVQGYMAKEESAVVFQPKRPKGKGWGLEVSTGQRVALWGRGQ